LTLKKTKLASSHKVHNFTNSSPPSDLIEPPNKRTNFIPTSSSIKTATIHQKYIQKSTTPSVQSSEQAIILSRAKLQKPLRDISHIHQDLHSKFSKKAKLQQPHH